MVVVCVSGMVFVVIGIVVVVFISGEGGGGIVIMCTLTVYSLHVDVTVTPMWLCQCIRSYKF